METPHKGSEFKNIIETWEQNEKNRSNSGSGNENSSADEPTAVGSDLEQVIKQEASEYDNENKENRILGGDRATINDDNGAEGTEQ